MSNIKLTHEELNDYIYYKDYVLSRLDSIDDIDELYSLDVPYYTSIIEVGDGYVYRIQDLHISRRWPKS